ncbi:unnamed protein product [Prorocentrum cordatum]|uniref:EF-hand domain-containing protein n=1 Tax=Prorocentrum cordatum TaxID=2364126 RepID=A0ABN9WBS9_9DINO|nr:unnamed protein product [Polarella glacialis]
MDVVDLDEGPAEPGLAPAAPRVCCPPPQVPYAPKAAEAPAGTSAAAGSRGRNLRRSCSEEALSRRELGEELCARLDQIDTRLEWLISRVRVTGIAATHCDSNASSTLGFSALDPQESVTSTVQKVSVTDTTPLRSAADAGHPPGAEFSASARAPAPAGPWPVGSPASPRLEVPSIGLPGKQLDINRVAGVKLRLRRSMVALAPLSLAPGRRSDRRSDSTDQSPERRESKRGTTESCLSLRSAPTSRGQSPEALAHGSDRIVSLERRGSFEAKRGAGVSYFSRQSGPPSPSAAQRGRGGSPVGRRSGPPSPRPEEAAARGSGRSPPSERQDIDRGMSYVSRPQQSDRSALPSHPSGKSFTAGSSSSGRGSWRARAGGTMIPNLSPKVHRHPGTSRVAGLRHASTKESLHVQEKSKKSFLVRRMLEKSSSKNIENVHLRFQSLPMAMRRTRNSTLDYIHTVLDDPDSSTEAWWISKCLEAIVLLSMLVTFLQTVEDPLLHGWSTVVAETTFDVVFLMELCVRVFCAPNKVNFLLIFHTWIDIAAASAIVVRAAAGFVLPESQDDAFSIILLGFVPIVRLLKILRDFESYKVLIQAIEITMEALPMLLYTVALITMTFASLIYLLEPELFESPFRAVWFCLVTITTVGYGDYSPTTTAGITIVMVLIVLGVILMAVPIGIMGNTFNQVWTSRDYSLLLSKTRKKLHQWGYSAHDIPTLFRAVHYSDCAVLELDDFIELVNDMKIGLSEDRIIALFENMDKDGSGALDAAEFAQQLFPGSRNEGFGYASIKELKNPSGEGGSPKLTRRSLLSLDGQTSASTGERTVQQSAFRNYQRQDTFELTASQGLTASQPVSLPGWPD